MRKVILLVALTACGGGHNNTSTMSDDDAGGSADACVGLQCHITDCAAMSLPPTSISGTVFAPNGSLPLYDVNVYVPNSDPGPFSDTLECSKCSDPVPGDPIVIQTTNEAGGFELDNIPDGDAIPVVITIGKWRREITIPHVTACSPTTIDAVDTTLPKSRTDMTPNTTHVDMPKIAISTGSADALECLILKLGIDPKEIASDGVDARVHLYADLASGGEGAAKFKAGFAGGTGNFADSATLWGLSTLAPPANAGKLANYDIAIFSCEGGQHTESKDVMSMANVKAYADLGGRVFLSHWHNIWVEGNTQTGGGTAKPMVWPTIATFSDANNTLPNSAIDTIDEVNNPKGASFAKWMLEPTVMGSTVQDQIPIANNTGKNTCTAVDNTKAEQWVAYSDPAHVNENGPQMFQFTTPNELSTDQRCGKVVFSDMHVSGDSKSPKGGSYPDSCATTALTSQEKALAFMFFDISSCVSAIP